MTDMQTIHNAASREETLEWMKKKLSHLMPPAALEDKAELVFQINRLKKELNAVILGHNYMEAVLFNTVPDYVGDSLELARISARTDADIIVFCGVEFMAETAKILNPGKQVLLPAKEAGCSLAAAISGDDVRNLKQQFPGVPVVSYVNTYAEVKAETDICCTSSNADKVVRHLFENGHNRVLFLPDEYLGSNVADELGVPIFFPSDAEPDAPKAMIGWKGRCEVHEQFTVDDITRARETHPGLNVLAHPECSREVVRASDFSGSTKQMIRHVKETDSEKYLLLTECSMGDNIVAENPDKELVRMCSIACPHMKTITLEDTLASLLNRRYEIELEPEMMDLARASLDRMISIG